MDNYKYEILQRIILDAYDAAKENYNTAKAINEVSDADIKVLAIMQHFMKVLMELHNMPNDPALS